MPVPPAVIASIFKSLGIDVEMLVGMAKQYLAEFETHNKLLKEIADNQRRMMEYVGLSVTEPANAGNTLGAGFAVNGQPNGTGNQSSTVSAANGAGTVGG